MTFKLEIERHYPHPIARVWEGLSNDAALTDWLMDTVNFKASAGHRFEMNCVDDSGKLDVYRCEVLEVDPPHRMVWSWALAGDEDVELTEVEFRLRSVDTGTVVTLTHSGGRDERTIDHFRRGWPGKLDRLAEALAADAR